MDLLWLLTAFVLTQLMEWPLFSWLAKISWKQGFFFMLLINLCTWPLACIFYWQWPGQLPLIECGIAVTESLFIMLWWRFSFLRSFLLGFLINGFSYGTGLIIGYLRDIPY